jgi:ABC-2 type transport system permease protein
MSDPATNGQISLLWHQYRLERRMFWRNPSAAFFNFLLPLLFLVVFGVIFRGNHKDLEIVLPGVAAMSIMSTTFTALAMNITFLREQGVLKRMRGTPISTGTYLGGVGLNAVTNTAIQIVLVVLAGRLVFGIGWPPDPLQVIVFTVAGVICLASIGVALSHVIPNFDSAPAIVNAVFLPAVFVSGVSLDTKHSPAFAKDLAQVLPLGHVVTGLKGGMVAASGGLGDHLGALAVIAAWAVGGVYLAVRGFSWESARS